MGRVRKRVLLGAALLALLVAGSASAYVVARTIWLKPGHCRAIHGRKVGARKAQPRTGGCARRPKRRTVARTTTGALSSTGQPSAGSANSPPPPMAIPPNGVVVHWP